MGAETASAIAAEAQKYGIRVRNLFVMEGPRVEPQNPLKLAKNFSSDSNNLKFAWKHPADPVMREIAKLDLVTPKGATTYGLAMTKGGVDNDLMAALQSQPDMKLIIGSAGQSKVSPPKASAAVYQKLHNLYPDRTRRIIMPGESRAYGDTGKRYANLAKIALR